MRAGCRRWPRDGPTWEGGRYGAFITRSPANGRGARRNHVLPRRRLYRRQHSRAGVYRRYRAHSDTRELAPTNWRSGNAVCAHLRRHVIGLPARRSVPKTHVGTSPGGLAVSPPGTPQAGAVFVSETGSRVNEQALGHIVTIVGPDGGIRRSVTVGKGPGPIAIVPAGVPGAGTAYVLNQGEDLDIGAAPQVQTVTRIQPGGSTRTFRLDQTPQSVVVAAKGTPEAGTVFIAANNGQFGSLVAIRPDGRMNVLSRGVGGTPLAIAPAGTPNAGTVFADGVTSSAIGLLVAPPHGTSRIISLIEDAEPQTAIAVAGPGTPHPGGIYLATVSPSSFDLGLVQQGAYSAIVPNVQIDQLAIAPGTAPNAGTVYATDGAQIQPKATKPSYLTIVRPDGTRSRKSLGFVQGDITVAPSGTPDAGTVFLSDELLNYRYELVEIAPDGATKTLKTGDDTSSLLAVYG